jgi:hypothetical protein
VLSIPTLAHAGMPSPALTDIARLRLQSIGFFLATFLVLAKLFQLLWNWLRIDFSSLPVLGYRRAMGLVFVWGMALELVLTMVSGARELLTPGAWEKVGVTYQVKPDVVGASVLDLSPAARRARIERLANSLRALSTLPRSPRTSGLPDDVWVAPGGARYVYLGDGAAASGLIAYEPPGLGDERLAIANDFSVIAVSRVELEKRMQVATP